MIIFVPCVAYPEIGEEPDHNGVFSDPSSEDGDDIFNLIARHWKPILPITISCSQLVFAKRIF
ncbi:hypothetical protein EKN09_28190 [Vibrio penaeicida]|uniref:Uncharacterized protein n=1 Tax=Vibrio penaeicida TaxID=104609 RepID=A0AAV5NQI0_9VIBR|nr:hypothetical protein [Vibrio penaeicida]RTZ19163.1 hypothetical protein EKN09_28190 [Vibrio penaeicida]GLQ72926.1 hypothetical protein GCM10007932_22860 [Vibrio penaeicida]